MFHLTRFTSIPYMDVPFEVFLLPCEALHNSGHKRDDQILPQLKMALHWCCSTDFCLTISDFHR